MIKVTDFIGDLEKIEEKDVKIIKTLALLSAVCLLAVFSSCGNKTDGFALVSREELPESAVKNAAVLNLASKTVHMDDECLYLKDTYEENTLLLEKDMAKYYIDRGYKYCKKCAVDYIE